MKKLQYLHYDERKQQDCVYTIFGEVVSKDNQFLTFWDNKKKLDVMIPLDHVVLIEEAD